MVGLRLAPMCPPPAYAASARFTKYTRFLWVLVYFVEDLRAPKGVWSTRCRCGGGTEKIPFREFSKSCRKRSRCESPLMNVTGDEPRLVMKDTSDKSCIHLLSPFTAIAKGVS
jgi:hypothetical protein